MKNFLNKLSKLQKIVLGLLVIIAIYFGYNFLQSKVIASNFFSKYNVQTVVGTSTFTDTKIALNGKIIEKAQEDWTNVLPIPGSLKYIKLVNTYSKGTPVQCGETTIPKKVEQYRDGENAWCVEFNNRKYVSISSPVYFPYDSENIVYEKCLKGNYYEGIYGKDGYNSCAERGLFINEEQIASTKEISVGGVLQESASFNYYPSKKIGSQIISSTDSATYSYDTITKEAKVLNKNIEYRLNDYFVTDEGKSIEVKENSSFGQGILLGSVDYGGRSYQQVYSADYKDGNFYILRLVAIDNEANSSGKILKFELLKNGTKIENIETSGFGVYGYDITAIREFPLCDTDTIVCIYENGHYAYKNRTLAPEVFSYDFYVDEMVIDGEWRGDNIPNLIGKSKPIFEDGKLKYLVYVGFPTNGLYLIDFDKKWTFKSLYNKTGPATTKLIGGYQNKLLNVLAK